MIALPTPHEILMMYEDLEKFYSVRPKPIRDSLMLELVCARPLLANTNDVFLAMGFLVEGLLANRPFEQLNIATILAVIQASCTLNGFRLACSPAVLNRTLKEWQTPHPRPEQVATWLKLASEPL